MATITGVTLQKAQEIKNDSIISARVENGILYFKKGDNQTEFNVGRIILPAIEAWPVGSIFMNTSPTNPKTLLGVPSSSPVTWVRWGKGRMPISLDETQSEFDAVEETGGAKTHTLSLAEIPNSSGQIVAHGSRSGWWDASGVFSESNFVTGHDAPDYDGGETSLSTLEFNSGGGGQPHNNMPPFITVYMWKRTI